MKLKDCGPKTRWLFLALGGTLAVIGGALTASVVGTIVGIPILLIAFPLLAQPRTVRVPCPEPIG